MTYRGTNDDRDRADEIYGAYVATFTRFVLWLLDQGRSVRVFIGDQTDDEALARDHWPGPPGAAGHWSPAAWWPSRLPRSPSCPGPWPRSAA